MRSSRKKFLSFPEVATIGSAIQAAVFGGIFGGKEWVTSTWGQVLFFPAATFFSILHFGMSVKKFINEKNKNFGKTASILLAGASLAAEMFAVTAAMLAYCGTAILAAGVVPIIFASMIGTNCVWNLLQAGYHGMKWATSTKGSNTRRAHGKKALDHLWGAAVCGAIAATITFLMVSPIALTVAAVIAVKTVGISFLALNILKIGHTFLGMHRQRKKEMAQTVPIEREPQLFQAQIGQLEKRISNLQAGPIIMAEPILQSNPIYMKVLEQDNSEDLISKLNNSDVPKEFILALLTEATIALNADLQHQNSFKRMFNDETQKRKDKLQVIGWMKDLVQHEFLTLPDGLSELRSVDELETRMKAMASNVFSSFFVSSISGGKVEKLFNLVKHYMAHLNDDHVYQKPVWLIDDDHVYQKPVWLRIPKP